MLYNDYEMDCEVDSMKSESKKRWGEQSLRKTESVRRNIYVQNQVLFSNRHSRSKKTCSILLNKELHKGIKGNKSA